MEVLGQIRVARVFSPVASGQRGGHGFRTESTPGTLRVH